MGRFKLVTVTKGFPKVRRCSKIWKTDLSPYFALTEHTRVLLPLIGIHGV